ncbi:MAG: SRPBCC family protein [Actinomycetota bacterium]|nr:SRPBCC family protein [Actinomycetota bacterium]MDH4354188.1 SRPBCC family protein [Actinomycetota bacterium]MDH5279295.1 SRPBCC family protein [Actinomycetota bacterium]
MTAPGAISVDVCVDAPVAAVWEAVTDWAGQSEWMLGTRVWATDRDGVGVGGGVAAFTGVGRLGFLDTMVITRWEPPYRCDVRHTGRVVRGTGTFEVFRLPNGRSRFVWSEELDLPLGRLGRWGWPVVRPAFALGVQRSLDKLARSLARSTAGQADTG